jgi:beta-glucosidase
MLTYKKCSFDRLNGSYACQNSKALNSLLKEELSFGGYVMSGEGAIYVGVANIETGMDMDSLAGCLGLVSAKIPSLLFMM